MCMATRIVFGFCLSISLSSCTEFREPDPLDPREFVGCYAENDFRIEIRSDFAMIDGEQHQYEITRRRVGLIISLPLIFSNHDGSLTSEKAGEHFYRILPYEDRYRIIIADQSGIVHELEPVDCS